MENTIFNVYVPMENQEQLKRLIYICLDNELTVDFVCLTDDKMMKFRYSECFGFGNWILARNKTKVTESEFIDLLKKYKL